MASNREWLFSKPWEEQLAWLDAEHVAVSTTPLEMPSEIRWQYQDGEWTAEVGAPKLQNSQSDAPKSEETDEIGAPKREMRNFDDSRENLEADVRKVLQSAYMYAWMHGYENRRGCSFEKLHSEFYSLLDRQAAITRAECDKPKRFTEVGKTSASSRQSDGMDSREKLVDEIAMFAGSRRQLIEKMQTWFDRQAAITRAELVDCASCPIAERNAKVIAELREKLDETKHAIAKAGGTWTEREDRTIAVVFAPNVDKLLADLEAAHAKNRALKAHIGKMQDGRHGWHIKAKEL